MIYCMVGLQHLAILFYFIDAVTSFFATSVNSLFVSFSPCHFHFTVGEETRLHECKSFEAALRLTMFKEMFIIVANGKINKVSQTVP